MTNQAKMSEAKKAFEAGEPIEIWARLVCEALGLEHGIATPSALPFAVLSDLATTTRTLNAAAAANRG